MRRAGAALFLIAAMAFAAPAAQAHPLGNFSTNHLSTVRISDDAVDVRYVLDQAEIPTVANKRLGRDALLRRLDGEAQEGLRLTVDGRRVALRRKGRARLRFQSGQAGLDTTRYVIDLSAEARDPTRVALVDRTFEGRVGWKAIVVEPGEGTAVRTNAPAGDPTQGLRRYPEDLLESPLNRREATFSVEPGTGTVAAPKSEGGEFTTTRDGESGGGFAAVFEDAASGEGVLLLLLLAAFGWGALHALSPGHGKTMVAAYLVGTRGTARHAVALGATVTVTHTIGVFALGLVTLALSQYVLPEDLYPWLTLVSGLMVVVIGAGVLRSRVRWSRSRSGGGEAHAGHHHDHDHHRDDDHPHDHGHDHDHHHHMPDDLSWRGLLGMGAAAGLIPCPSALVVLLGAIGQHEVGLGLLLILAFSLGLAGTLTALGLAVVYAKRMLPRLNLGGPLVSALPALSALLIVGVGVMITAQAVPDIV